MNAVTVKEVADMLGTTELTVRVGLQKGIFPFGVAFKLKEGNKQYKYVFFPEKVREYCGMKGGQDEDQEN